MATVTCIIWYGLLAFIAGCVYLALRSAWILFLEWMYGGTGTEDDPQFELATIVFAIGGLAFSVVAGTVAAVIAIYWRPCL